ncbi:MAG: recombinase family protein [Chloroflexi bacterium]|nr:recombinase family protein [Chloroflexota bacterium]
MPDDSTENNTFFDTGTRFFVASNPDIIPNHPLIGSRMNPNRKQKKHKKKRKVKMRYAAYVRISSEEQIGNYSVDAQKRAIETWVIANGGILSQVYVDEGHSGRTANRPEFKRMRQDARKRKFDAVIVHKFDRFARNRTDALAIKSLLRHDYGIKILSVSEPSEDSDGPMGALIEGIMESVADWYSQNLAAETAKGKKERSHQGMHNNRAPFGMKKDEMKNLVPHENELPGLLLAYESYAKDKFSDNDIAKLLNKAGYHSNTGRPFSKETIRDILQNRTYLGKVRYQKYKRRSNGTRSFEEPIEWFDGQHNAVISEELFERCQQVRAKRRSHHMATPKYQPYLLRTLIYCHNCLSNPPEDKTFRLFGMMRPQSQSKGSKYQYYRCRSKELGYDCEQKSVRVPVIDEQVINILMQLKPPKGWREGIVHAMGELLGEKNLEERLGEIHAIIKRMDTRWDNGFIIDEQEYLEKRIKLQMELEQLAPVPDDDLDLAADMLQNFKAHWERLEGDDESRHELVKLIVERVYVGDKKVVAMTLRSKYHLVLGHKTNEPTYFEADPFLYRSGSDGT